MSPRAACRLETLGFFEVYDSMPGKVDWLARGLAREGEKAGETRAFDLVADDVVTCGLDELVGEVRARVAASRYGFAFVVSGGRVLLGRLRRTALEAAGEARAEDVMEPGPSTIRADSALGLTSLPVTDPDGRLLGVVRRDDLERARVKVALTRQVVRSTLTASLRA